MNKKVVIIDDSLMQLHCTKKLFKKYGWDVLAFLDAKEGYDEIFTFAPDLIITDALMPNIGGFQLVKLIRENELISKIPIIVYSVLSESNAKFYIKKEMNEFFLKKSDDLMELLRMAHRVTKEHPLDDRYKLNIIEFGYKLRDIFDESVLNDVIKDSKEEKTETKEINQIFKDNIDTKYSNNETYFLDKINSDKLKKYNLRNFETYFVIINIKNYKELEANLLKEDFDTVNTKISEKIINYIDQNEQIHKNFNDEYVLIMYAKDKENIQFRLDCILDAINSIEFDDNNVIAQIVASNCEINNNFNIYEAQKITRKLLESITTDKKAKVK